MDRKTTTLEMIEKSDIAVESALRMLSVDENRGWWSHLYGSAETDPDNRPVDAEGRFVDASEVGVAKLGQREVPAGAAWARHPRPVRETGGGRSARHRQGCGGRSRS